MKTTIKYPILRFEMCSMNMYYVVFKYVVTVKVHLKRHCLKLLLYCHHFGTKKSNDQISVNNEFLE